MMGRFLDALGIAHENGLIKEDEREARSGEAGAGGGRARRRSFRPKTCALSEHAALPGSGDVGRLLRS